MTIATINSFWQKIRVWYSKTPLLALLLLIVGLTYLILHQSIFNSQTVVAQGEYVVSRYEAAFEPVPNQNGELSDVLATVLVEYDLNSGSKNDSFKFVGENAIINVSVTDGVGEPLPFKLQNINDTQLDWTLPIVLDGKQIVIIKFTIKDAIQGDLTENYFIADWVKNWSVPVGNTIFRFTLPDGYQYKGWSVMPARARSRQINNRHVIEVFQNKVSDKPFKITVKPGFATNYQTGTQQVNNSGQNTTPNKVGEYLFFLLCIFPLVSLTLISIYLGRKNLPTAADQGLWDL